jgi:hypothetical protein
MAGARLSAFLPFRAAIDGKREDYLDNPQRAQLLLDSLGRFYGSPIQMTIAAPASDLRAAPTGSGTVSISVVDEETIAPGLGALNVSGWYKQQVLKLAFCATAATPWVLVLDPDILQIRAATESDLLPEGRALTNLRSKNMSLPGSYRYACELLGVEPIWNNQIFDTTPKILSQSVCQGLAQALEARGLHWLDLAQQCGWTEYALYCAWAERTDALGGHANGSLLGRSLFSDRQRRPWPGFDPASGYFSVISSRTNISPADARASWNRISDL